MDGKQIFGKPLMGEFGEFEFELNTEKHHAGRRGEVCFKEYMVWSALVEFYSVFIGQLP